MNPRTKFALTGALAGLVLLASSCSAPNPDLKSKKILKKYYLSAVVSEGYTNYAAFSKSGFRDVSAEIESRGITQEDLRRAYISKYGEPIVNRE